MKERISFEVWFLITVSNIIQINKLNLSKTSLAFENFLNFEQYQGYFALNTK